MIKLSPTTKFIIEGFIPYTKANLLLSFKPYAFFNELEKKHRINSRTVRSAYYRLIQRGYIELQDGRPQLTAKGRAKASLYSPQKLQGNAWLLVSFDIPEGERHKRSHLRLLLRELSFTKIQQSLWATKFDYREYLLAEITEHALEDYVIIFEAHWLTLK